MPLRISPYLAKRLVRIRRIGAGGGGGLNPALAATVWNPGAAPGPGYVTTWAEVMTTFAETSGEFRVFLDTSGGGAFSIPAGTYDLDSRLQLARPAASESQVTVVMADGAILQNPAGLYRNITLQANNTTDPAIELSDGSGMELDLGCILENAGSVPMIAVATGDTVSLGFYRGSSIDASGDVLVDIDVNGTLEATFQDNSQSYDDWATGDATATLAITYDATYIATGLTSAPGTVTETPVTRISASSTESLFLSPVDYIVAAAGGAASLTMTAGSQTRGARFTLTQDTVIAGIRFAWGTAAPAARTIRCSLWNTAGTRLTFVDYALSGAGVYSALFATPYSLTALGAGQNFYYSIWDTSGGHTVQVSSNLCWPGTIAAGTATPYLLSRSMIVTTTHRSYSAGTDAAPLLVSATNHYPSEPIFV